MLRPPQSDIDKSVMLSAIYKQYDKPIVFLPNYGEFGGVIDKLIKIVHFSTASDKIVCCKKGEEAYYPSVSKFFYDWSYDIIDDEHKWGFFSKKRYTYNDNEKRNNHKYAFYKKMVGLDVEKIKSHFGGGYEYIHLWNFNQYDWTWTKEYSHKYQFELTPLVENDLCADIIISPRNKKCRPDNNFGEWDKFIEIIKKRGFKIGLIGSKSSSSLIKDCDCFSWKYEDNASACIEMLKKCKLYVGLDTGTSHLASFMNVPMIVFQANRPNSSSTWIMRKMTKNYFCDLGHNVSVDTVIKKVLEYLES